MRRDVWKGFAHLFPDAEMFRDYRLEAFGEGEPELVVWNLPDPVPTDAELDQAILDYDAAREQERQEAEAEQAAVRTLRGEIRSTAQSAVGVRFDQLTAAQLRALLAVLLYREGALDRSGVVRPPAEWASWVAAA